MSEKIAVHCPTEEDWDRVQRKALNNGLRWRNGIKHYSTEKIQESSHRFPDICLDLSEEDRLNFSPIKYYKNMGHTIISAKKYLKEGGEEMEFKVGDEVTFVKEGMIGWEDSPWWEKEELVVGNIYVITSVSSEGNISLIGNGYIHHPGHFQLTNKQTKTTKKEESKMSTTINSAIENVFGQKRKDGSEMLLVNKHLGKELNQLFDVSPNLADMWVEENEKSLLKKAQAMEAKEL